jgi:hypothetical protein
MTKLPTPAQLREQAIKGLAVDIAVKIKELSTLAARSTLLNRPDVTKAINRAVANLGTVCQYKPGK